MFINVSVASCFCFDSVGRMMPQDGSKLAQESPGAPYAAKAASRAPEEDPKMVSRGSQEDHHSSQEGSSRVQRETQAANCQHDPKKAP